MLYIVTPCSRPENLKRIKETIPGHATWVVLYDKNVKGFFYSQADITVYSLRTGLWGHPLRNEFLDLYEESFTDKDWVYMLDDDNIFHPALADRIKDLMNTSAVMVNWNQGRRLKATTEPAPGKVDTASYMYRPQLGLRYTEAYEADGIFAQELTRYGSVDAIDEDLCYYNYLK